VSICRNTGVTGNLRLLRAVFLVLDEYVVMSFSLWLFFSLFFVNIDALFNWLAVIR